MLPVLPIENYITDRWYAFKLPTDDKVNLEINKFENWNKEDNYHVFIYFEDMILQVI